MQKNLPHGLTDTLLWSDELGYGWHPRQPMSYEGDYWDSYVERDASPMGKALTQARIDLVRGFMGHEAHKVVDIGIGGGRFVEEMNCLGFDVNDKAIEWLDDNNRLVNPYWQDVDSITCWDSLEHIPDMEALLDRVRRFVFVSMPIYKDQSDCLKSKHYKPGEHIWYFTTNGLIQYMDKLGFECLLVDDRETQIGREGILSFAFRRIA
jgi:hypothetical protein